VQDLSTGQLAGKLQFVKQPGREDLSSSLS
jgi:hypothetical protein